MCALGANGRTILPLEKQEGSAQCSALEPQYPANENDVIAPIVCCLVTAFKHSECVRKCGRSKFSLQQFDSFKAVCTSGRELNGYRLVCCPENAHHVSRCFQERFAQARLTTHAP